MARIAKIATTSLATLEDTAPPFNLRYPDPADTLKLRAYRMLDAAGAQGADLAVLPEGFMAAGCPPRASRSSPSRSTARRSRPSPSGRSGTRCTSSPASTRRSTGTFRTSAALIDRSGRLVGTYSKRHPTEGEIDNGVVPGDAAPRLRYRFRPRRPCDLLRPELAGPLGGRWRERRRARLLDLRL